VLVTLKTGEGADFRAALQEHGHLPFRRGTVSTLQVNVGKICNQACLHCHVEAGPKRTESMSRETAERVLFLLNRSPEIHTVDITGGAPEINSSFRELVTASRDSGRHVIDRCNLTILLEPGFETLPSFLAENGVNVTASLPCYTASNVDEQRGRGVFEKSIEALRQLNRLGYGRAGSGLELNLVYNPLGPTLPPPQDRLEQDYKRHLVAEFGIEFNRLLTITNMPIARFAEVLRRTGKGEQYKQLLVDHFDPATLSQLMCRSLVSVGWDGGLYDCDFNQMLEVPVPARRTIWEIESFDELSKQLIATGSHCFGCTAGTGSSCGGQLS
jgi:radical SAM/Cys-rich protein